MPWIRPRFDLMWAKIEKGYAENFTFKGLGSLLLAVATLVPDLFGREDFWAKKMHLIWIHLLAHGKASILILCALFIWLDHRRMINNREPKPHDARSLKGRTLKLCDELRGFRAEVGRKPDVNRPPGMITPDYIDLLLATRMPWTNKITYGYELRFKESVYRTYAEFGERNLLPGMVINLPDHVSSDEDITKIINDLAALAERFPN